MTDGQTYEMAVKKWVRNRKREKKDKLSRNLYISTYDYECLLEHERLTDGQVSFILIFFGKVYLHKKNSINNSRENCIFPIDYQTDRRTNKVYNRVLYNFQCES